MGCGKGKTVGDWHHDHCRQKLRRFRQGQRQTVQARIALAARQKRALHRHPKIIRRIGHCHKPAQIGVPRHRDARKIAVIGACLQRLGAARGQGQVHLTQRAQVGKARRRQRLDRHSQHRAAVANEHNRQPKPQITAGAGKGFGLVRAQAHGL